MGDEGEGAFEGRSDSCDLSSNLASLPERAPSETSAVKLVASEPELLPESLEWPLEEETRAAEPPFLP